MLHLEHKQQNWNSVPGACSCATFLECFFVSHVSGHIKNYKPSLSNLRRELSVPSLLCTLICVSASTLVVLSVSLFSVHILGCLVSDVCSSSWLWVTCFGSDGHGDGWRRPLVAAYGPECTSQKAGDDKFQTDIAEAGEHAVPTLPEVPPEPGP